MSTHTHLPFVPLNRREDFVQKSESRIPTIDTASNRGPADLLRRYPNGTLDIDTAVDRIVELITRIKDVNQGGRSHLPLDASEKAILTVVIPGVVLGIPENVAQTMLRISGPEKLIIRAKVVAKIKEIQNWNAGRGGGAVPGADMTVSKALGAARASGQGAAHGVAPPPSAVSGARRRARNPSSTVFGGPSNAPNYSPAPQESSRSRSSMSGASQKLDNTKKARVDIDDPNYTDEGGREYNVDPSEEEDKSLTQEEMDLKKKTSKMSKARRFEKAENNPWAICTASVGRGDKDKYERCVQDVKAQKGFSSASDILSKAFSMSRGDLPNIPENPEITNADHWDHTPYRHGFYANHGMYQISTPYTGRVGQAGAPHELHYSSEGSKDFKKLGSGNYQQMMETAAGHHAGLNKGDQRADPKTPERAYPEIPEQKKEDEYGQS